MCKKILVWKNILKHRYSTVGLQLSLYAKLPLLSVFTTKKSQTPLLFNLKQVVEKLAFGQQFYQQQHHIIHERQTKPADWTKPEALHPQVDSPLGFSGTAKSSVFNYLLSVTAILVSFPSCLTIPNVFLFSSLIEFYSITMPVLVQLIHVSGIPMKTISFVLLERKFTLREVLQLLLFPILSRYGTNWVKSWNWREKDFSQGRKGCN